MSYYIVVTEEWYGGSTGSMAVLSDEEKAITELVCGDVNTELKVFEDLKTAKEYRDYISASTNRDAVIIKQSSEYLQNKEKEICQLKEQIRKQAETLAQHERTITKLYYSPGAPGAVEAKEEFVKLANNA